MLGLVDQDELLHRVGRALVDEGSERVEQRRDLAVQSKVDEHEPTPDGDFDRRQHDVGGIEPTAVTGAEIPGRAEPAVETISPAVIPAHQARHSPAPLVDQGPRPMAADVVVAPQLAVVVDHHHQ